MVKRLGDVLADIVPKGPRSTDRERAFNDFSEIAGLSWSGRLMNLGYESGRLKLGVGSHADLQEARFQKADWEILLRERNSRVRQLDFSINQEGMT